MSCFTLALYVSLWCTKLRDALRNSQTIEVKTIVVFFLHIFHSTSPWHQFQAQKWQKKKLFCWNFNGISEFLTSWKHNQNADDTSYTHQRSVLLRDEHPGLLWLYKIWVKSGDCVGRIFSGFPLRKKLAICYDMIMTWTTHDLEKTPKIYHRKTEEICVYVRSMTVQGVRTHLILHNSAFSSFQQQQFHLCKQFMLFETWGLVWQKRNVRSDLKFSFYLWNKWRNGLLTKLL